MAASLTLATLKDTLGITGTASDFGLTRQVAVWTGRVERFAPDAPGDVQDEAVIRALAYARQSPGPFRGLRLGTISLDFAVGGIRAPFAASGARSLLNPWRARRALPVEDTS